MILTSNSEKTLPEAFLRRCVFFHIEMPDSDELCDILLAKKQIFPEITRNQVKAFVRLFLKIARTINGKKPATHELILWVWWMLRQGFTPEDIYTFNAENTGLSYRNEIILSGFSILAKETDDLVAVKKAITANAIKEE